MPLISMESIHVNPTVWTKAIQFVKRPSHTNALSGFLGPDRNHRKPAVALTKTITRGRGTVTFLVFLSKHSKNGSTSSMAWKVTRQNEENLLNLVRQGNPWMAGRSWIQAVLSVLHSIQSRYANICRPENNIIGTKTHLFNYLYLSF